VSTCFTASQIPDQPVSLRWMIDRAIDRSGLPPLGRHVLSVLLKKADVATAEVPIWRCPSYTELAAATGLGRSTVIRYVKQLCELGWLVRIVPSKIGSLIRRERNRYRIQLPPHLAGPAVTDVSAGRPLVSERDSSLDLKDVDQKIDARARARVTADQQHGKVRRKIFPEKGHQKPTTPVLAGKGVTPADQQKIIAHVQRLAKQPIGNMNAYLTAMDRNGQLEPLIAATCAPAREHAARVAETPQYLIDLNARRNAATSIAADAKAAIRNLLGRNRG